MLKRNNCVCVSRILRLHFFRTIFLSALNLLKQLRYRLPCLKFIGGILNSKPEEFRNDASKLKGGGKLIYCNCNCIFKFIEYLNLVQFQGVLTFSVCFQ
jgi:hypothetical protein